MKIRRYLVCGIALCINGVTGAGQPISQTENFYSVISAGVDFLRTNGNQSISLLTPYHEYYTGNQSYKTSGSLGLGFASNAKHEKIYSGKQV